MAAETEEQVVIPVGWFQRLTRNQALALISAVIGAGVWVYDLNGDVLAMKERLARTEAKLEAMSTKYAEQDKANSVTLATLGVSLLMIDKRLTSIESNVRKMAQ